MKESMFRKREASKQCILALISFGFGAVRSLALSLIDKNEVGIEFWSMFGCSVVCFLLLNAVYYLMSIKTHPDANRKYGKKHWEYCFALLLLSYSVCFLTYFPGVGMNDGLNIMCWGIGQAVQFPLFYCAFVTVLTWIGQLFGSLQITVVLYTIIQVLLVSAISAGIVVWFWNRPVHRIFKVFLTVYYAAEPLLAMYAISMLKDTLFSLFLTVLIILTYELLHNRPWIREKTYWALLIVTAVGVIYTRNNGSYVVIPFLIILFASVKQYRRGIIHVLLAVVLAMAVAKLPFLIFQREHLFQETVGIPLQQIAAVNAKEGYMTEEQKAFLDHILPLENWKNDYNPGSADPLKWNHEKFDTKFLNE